MKKKLLFIITTLLTTVANATVDELYVNEITKEYQYSDIGCLGFIGWHSVKADPSAYYSIENKLLQDGYKQMNIPFKIEFTVIVIVVILTLILFLIRKRIKAIKNE